MTPEYTNQLAAQLLLSGLATVILLGVGIWFAIMHARQRPTLSIKPSTHTEADTTLGREEATAYQPSVFDQACRWLIIRNSHLTVVQASLGLHNPKPCSWGEGMSSVAARKLFISPPIRGWILVVGQGLPDPVEDVDQCYHLVCRLSRALGQVQFFSVNRALNHHAWARAEGGRICRAYAWGGETLWNEGEVTPAETALGMQCLSYGESAASLDLGNAESPQHNTDRVLGLAARWSLDPTAVNHTMVQASLGLAGELARPRAR